MKKRTNKLIFISLGLISLATVGGTFAVWSYGENPSPVEESINNFTSNFTYGLLYITEINITNDVDTTSIIEKTGDLTIDSDITLTDSSLSSITFTITIFNSTSGSYYYDKYEVLSTNNENIELTVLDMVKDDEVLSNSYKTFTCSFSYKDSLVSSNKSLLSSINFKFNLDSSAVEDVAATIVSDKFADVLNNGTIEDSYEQLIDAMDSRTGSGWFDNSGSSLTYIGNVSGASNTDSTVIKELFGEEFLMMDLDGNGVEEPITLMIKRKNIDDDTTTGCDYSYTTSFFGQTTQHDVFGCEMTIYITSQDLSNVSNGQSIVVYASVFTKYPNTDEWVSIVPLTQGSAEANNYNGYGSANSFNTDTWRDVNNLTIEEVVKKYI